MKTVTGTQVVVVMAALALSAPALAAEAGAHGPNWAELGSAIVNFLLYISIIVYFARKPIASFFASRRAQLTSTMDEAAARQAEATARVETLQAKLDGFDAERAALVSEYRELGEREASKMREAAQSQAAKIAEDAKVTAEVETRRALSDLERRMVDRAIELAREQLETQLGPAGQQALIERGIAGLSTAAS